MIEIAKKCSCESEVLMVSSGGRGGMVLDRIYGRLCQAKRCVSNVLDSPKLFTLETPVLDHDFFFSGFVISWTLIVNGKIKKLSVC